MAPMGVDRLGAGRTSLADGAVVAHHRPVDPASSGTAVLTADAISALPPVPLGGIEGVSHRVLWQSETSMAGVLTVAAGHRLGTHAHRLNHHHMWVIEGSAVILGKDVGPGSYVHIPGGVEHDIDATASQGCTVFYLYLRPGE
jgi:quercetin dioxygenase-like cupin family protein